MFFPQNIYIFCTCPRQNIEGLHIKPSKTGFYNRGGNCLLRGTDWTFKQNGLGFVLKWLKF